jgi:glycosyltransferase involved in cell wall biosynthesis/tetratricopeptide (TPR) repeat protein
MSLRYLFGPVSRAYADEYLAEERQAGLCRCFGTEPGLDLRIDAGDRWPDVLEHLSGDWRPDFIVLYLQYASVPPALARAPLPVVGLAGDWNLQWHSYRRLLGEACDLMLTDALGVKVFHRAGLAHARSAYLFGGSRTLLEAAWPAGSRDIDVLFVGNVHPAVQRERLPYLGRIAALGERYHVVIRAGVFGAEYRRLLARSRIVFNRAIRSECNMRVAEAVAAGALLFQEAGNQEVPQLLLDGLECVFYDEENLETLLRRFLEDESCRAMIAEAARARLAELGFTRQWQAQLEQIESEWPVLCERAAERSGRTAWADAIGEVWQAVSCPGGPDRTLRQRLTSALSERPRDAALLNALGVTFLASGAGGPEARAEAAHAFQQAWSSDPRHAVAGLNLAETLVAMGQRANAAEQCRRVLALLDATGGLHPAALDDPLAMRGFEWMRVEWERAAWQHAGERDGEARAKVELLRWRLYALLGDLAGDLLCLAQACLLRPDLPPTRAALARALLKHGRAAEAVPHMEQVLRDHPFDNATAEALYDALGSLGLTGRQMALARTRRQLSAAAPGLVPAEARFKEPLASAGAEANVGRVFHPAGEGVGNPADIAEPLRVVWQGAQDAVHSLALVNRNLCAALVARGHELSLVPPSGYEPAGRRVPLPEALASCVGKALSGPADIHVTHQWPPEFTPPGEGRWVIIQPWEFGSIPKAWLAPLRDRVDELWVPSRFVRNCFVQDGVPAAKVHVVPNGVAEVFFEEGIAPHPLRTDKQFRFLYVGGTLPRKGIDVLLKAYRQVFCDRDDVCLVIKDMGVGTFYQGQTAEAAIEHLRRQPHAPKVEYLAEELTDAQMAALYRACDCVVLPYRGEGFCLPAAEAMASGRPVIVTGYGPVLDYATDETAYLLPYHVVSLGQKRVGEMETVNVPFLAEPDVDALRYLLRHVVEHRDEARRRGARAREHLRARLTWTHVAAIAAQRLAAVAEAPYVGQALTPAAVATKPHVSLTMIVKNEAHNLPTCLGSVADLVDEIIVVDTGSTDDTVAVAERHGARVFHFPWVDSFAAARNETLRHARGEWVFWMDADDRLDAENREKFRRLLAELPSDRGAAYIFKCLCMPDPETGAETEVDHVRLFPNLPGLQWEHRVHEQILPALRRREVRTRWCDVTVHHVGYQDPAQQPAKLQRNLRLLTLEYQEQQDHPFTLFNLGQLYLDMGRVPEALEMLRRSLADSAVTDSIVRKLYTLIARCEQRLNRPAEALVTIRAGRAHYPEDVELLFQESLLLGAVRDVPGAISCLERILDDRDSAHFASVDKGLRGYKARHNLATYYMELGRPDMAEMHWQRVLDEKPGYLPAIVGLGDVAVARQDEPGLQAILMQLHGIPQAAADALVLRARLYQARQEFATARPLLEEAIAMQPRALWPRIVLSQVLLQEGDWAAAERALRAVLEIDPDHAASRERLQVLLGQQGRKQW